MKDNKIKLITEILAIVVIALVSFVGVYKQKYNIMENQVKGYEYSKDLDGYREIVLEASSEEKAETENNEESNNEDTTENSEEKDKEENSENNEENVENDNKYEDYKTSKNIIEKRLKSLGAQDYTISQNNENGTIYIQIPENEDTDFIIGNLARVGKFEVKDSEDESKIFLTHDNLKKVHLAYNKSVNGKIENIQLEFNFNKEGKNILKDLSSNEYKTGNEPSTSQDENSENLNEESNENAENNTNDSSTEESESKTDEKTQKKVVLSLDESPLITTSFDRVIENGAIDLTMNNSESTDTDTDTETFKSALAISSILNSGEMPLTYEVKQNAYVQTDISKENINKAYIAIGAIFAIALIYLIIKFKEKGIVASIAYIGFLALDLLIVRYTNVLISIESIVTEIIILAMNYLFVYELLKMNENTKTWDLFKSQILKAIPIVLIGVIFAFTKFTKLSTCGMFIFWGVTLSFIYNYVLTINMIKQIRKGANINEE